MNLTPKQEAFALEYIKNGGNASDAARKAGYSNGIIRNATKKLLEKGCISAYIAEKQSLIEKQKGTDIMSLAEIQQRRSMIARGELTDSFGFAPDFSDQLKSMNDLEKTLAIKEAREEQQKAEEKARLQGEYHIDLNIVPDVFHKMIRVFEQRNIVNTFFLVDVVP